MRNGGVDGNNEVEIRHDSGGVHESAGASVEIVAERLDAEPSTLDLLGSEALLQADETHALNRGERGEARKRRRAGHIEGGVGISLPGDADLEAMPPQPFGPFTGARRFRLQVGNVGGDGAQPGLEGARQAEEMDLVIEPLGRIGLRHKAHARNLAEKLDHVREAFDRSVGATSGEHRKVAGEHERVAVSRLLKDEELLAGDVLAIPNRKARLALRLAAVAGDPAILVALPASFEVAEQKAERAEVRMPFREIGLQGERMLEVALRRFDPAKVLQREPAPAKGCRRRRVGEDRLFEPGKRRFGPGAFEVHDAAPEQRFDAFGVLRQRSVEHRGGLLQAPQFSKGRSPVAEDPDMLRTLSERCIEGGQRFEKEPRLEKKVAVKQQGFGVGGLHSQKPVAGDEGIVVAAKLLQRCGGAVKRALVSGDEPERSGEAFARLRVTAGRGEDRAEIVPRGFIAGVGGGQRPERG